MQNLAGFRLERMGFYCRCIVHNLC